jgi:hypothetical protein
LVWAQPAFLIRLFVGWVPIEIVPLLTPSHLKPTEARFAGGGRGGNALHDAVLGFGGFVIRYQTHTTKLLLY